MNSRLFAILALFATPFLNASADDRLDAVLEEVRALRAQVTALETRVADLEGVVQPIVQIATETAAATSAGEPPKEKWYDKMRIELIKAETRASGPWVEPGVWDKIERGMKEDEVRAILGEPTREKFSVRKDTDLILIYEGDLNGTGQLIEGEVRIYKGKVARFEPPVF